jgi:hypothetical protein
MDTKKPGQKPISEKREHMDFDPLRSKYDLPPGLKQELKEQGLDYRFLHIPTLDSNFGYHQSGWVVYKLKAPIKTLGGNEMWEYRIGEHVLGVRTKEMTTQHRARIELKNKAQQQAAEQARKRVQRIMGGVDSDE